jgi:hypothetical protein
LILYNVTVQVDENLLEDWLTYMKEIHIPEVMECGIFSKYKMCRIIGSDSQNTYSIQYFCDTLADFQRYETQFAPSLQKDHSMRYKDKFVAFRTILEVVSESK